MEPKEYRLAAVMFTDIVGFSRMMEDDEVATLELLTYHNRLLSEKIEAHRGRVIKTIGDAFLAEFSSCLDAVNCAVAIQDGLAADARQGHEKAKLLHLRIGVHVGDVFFFENDALGDGVNVASRLQGIAAQDTVWISEDVYRLTRHRLSQAPQRQGEVTLKNIKRDVAVYELSTERAEAGGAGSVREKPAGAEASKGRASGGGAADRATVEESSHSDQGASQEGVTPQEIKRHVLREIKAAGRRLSVSEARMKLPEEYAAQPVAGEILEQLGRKGILTSSQRIGAAGAAGAEEMEAGPELQPSPAPEAKSSVPQPPASRGDADQDDVTETAWDRVLEMAPAHGPATFPEDPLLQDYVAQTRESVRRARKGLTVHGSIYGALVLLWISIWASGGGGFPWFLIPALAWGIGLSTHVDSFLRRKLECHELDSIRNLNREHVRLLRQLARERASFRGHLVPTAATSLLLATINLITLTPPWSLIPIAVMGATVLGRISSYREAKSRIVKQLKRVGAHVAGALDGGSRKGAKQVALSEDMSATEKAEELGKAIQAQIKRKGGDRQVIGEEFLPVLSDFMSRVHELEVRRREIAGILQQISSEGLRSDLEELHQRRENATNEQVAAEYDRSIAQIERQQSSYRKLRNEQEMLRLRLNSAVSSLKQLHLDLARVNTLQSSDDAASVSMIRAKSREISDYLADVRAAQSELGQAELE